MIIVGTFLDKMTVTPEEKLAEIEKLNALFWEKLPSMKDSLQLCPVSCSNTEGIVEESFQYGHTLKKRILFFEGSLNHEYFGSLAK